METLPRREKERQARQAEIVAAAERIFCRRGYADASMDEIAKEAQFTKRTVYQYFTNKEDLYCAVALEGNKRFFARQQAAMAEGGTGLARFRRVAAASYEFYRDFPDLFRLISNAGRAMSAGGNGPGCRELARFRQNMLAEYAKVIEDGKADGSIRPDLDTREGVPALVLMLTGFLLMLADPGRTGDFVLDREALARCAMDLLADAVQAK